jgi:hypothetical protein
MQKVALRPQAVIKEGSNAATVRCGCRVSFAPATVGRDWQTADHDAPDPPDLLLLGLHEYTKSEIGRPSLASADKHTIIGDGQDRRGGSGVRRALNETPAHHRECLLGGRGFSVCR